MDSTGAQSSSWNGVMESSQNTDKKANGDTCQRKISAQACDVLSELRENGQLCDAVLKAEGVEFMVHRPIMSACSPYFRALFTSGLHETQQKELEIPGISARMMELIVNYAYTREAHINSENVEELLPIADYLHILGLLKLCCQYLESNLSVENCIGIRAFARAYFCTELEKESFKFLLRTFRELSVKSNEMLTLSSEDMVEILSHDELNVKTEKPVFEAIIRWIDYQPDSRKKHIFTLLQCARLYLLDTSYFVEKVKYCCSSLLKQKYFYCCHNDQPLTQLGTDSCFTRESWLSFQATAIVLRLRLMEIFVRMNHKKR